MLQKTITSPDGPSDTVAKLPRAAAEWKLRTLVSGGGRPAA